MSLSDCLKIAHGISASDNDALLAKVDVHRATGMSANDAAVAAAQDMLAQIRSERLAAESAARAQHPDLFKGEPKRQARSHYFTNPADYNAETRLKRKGSKDELVDEQNGAAPVKPGQPFVVYRVGAGDELANRNAGNASAIGLFLTRLDNVDQSQPVGEKLPDVITAYKVVLEQPFSHYEAGTRGLPMAKKTVGRVDGRLGVSYSFPAKGAYRAEPIASVPIERVREIAQQMHGMDDFDDMGGNLASAVVQEAFAQQMGDDESPRFQRQPTYASRQVLNAGEIASWAHAQGFPSVVRPEDMHVTQAYSKTPMVAADAGEAPSSVTSRGGERSIKLFGDDKSTAVLAFDHDQLQQRHREFKEAGASFDYARYQPHITISYDVKGFDASKVKPYTGPIELGPETVERIDTEPSANRGDEDTGGEPSATRFARNLPALPGAVAPVKSTNHAGAFQLKAFGLGGRVIEAIQDRYNRWKQVVSTVERQGGVITEANDFYRAEERYWGRVSTRIEDFDHQLDSFLEAIAKDKLTLNDVQTWAYAKHAFERNAYMRTLRGGDAFSGMSDSHAQAIIDDATNAGLDAALERHRKTLQTWVQGTRDIMLADGLITPDEHARLTGMFSDYVPLRGLKDKDGNDIKPSRTGTGSGFDVRGKETKRAKGRYSEADHIIENIVQDRTRALIRSGKNEVMRSFLQFVMDNPSPNLWEVNAVERKAVFTTDSAGNQVVAEQQGIMSDAGRTVSIKDGGREVYVQIKDAPLLEQLKNLNTLEVGRFMGVTMMANRVLSRLYTSLSPVFTVMNGLRDAQEATMGMVQATGFRGAARTLLNIPRAMREGMRAEFGTPSAEYQLYRSTGGKTGFFDFKSIDDQAKDLQKRLANAERSNADPRVWGAQALHLIEKINGGIENATRLAAFSAARAEGKTDLEAASISKNITVNFNRKGTMSNGLGALWLFFNPAVQGTARLMQTLKSPKAIATIGAAMAGVAALALQNANMGDDDDGIAWWDKIPSSMKDRSLIIVLPPGSSHGDLIPGSRIGRYLKVPMPYGYSFFAQFANQGVDLWRHHQDAARGRPPANALMQLLGSFLNSYLPSKELGNVTDNPKSLIMAMVPDALNPIAQSMLNMNSFGQQMYPEDERNPNAPDASKFFASQAGTIFQKAAEKLNQWTGGSKFTSGAIDLTPATIENLVRTYGGGPASFVLDLLNAEYARQTIKRPDLDARRLPFVKQLYGQIDAESDRMAGFDRMKDIASKVDPIVAAVKAGDNEEASKLFKEAGPIATLGGALKEARSELSDVRKAELAVINSEVSDDRKYSQLVILNTQKRLIEQNLNRAYNAAARAPMPGTVTVPLE